MVWDRGCLVSRRGDVALIKTRKEQALMMSCEPCQLPYGGSPGWQLARVAAAPDQPGEREGALVCRACPVVHLL